MTSIDTKDGTDVIETETDDNEMADEETIGSVAETGLTARSDINKYMESELKIINICNNNWFTK